MNVSVAPVASTTLKQERLQQINKLLMAFPTPTVGCVQLDSTWMMLVKCPLQIAKRAHSVRTGLKKGVTI